MQIGDFKLEPEHELFDSRAVRSKKPSVEFERHSVSRIFDVFDFSSHVFYFIFLDPTNAQYKISQKSILLDRNKQRNKVRYE